MGNSWRSLCSGSQFELDGDDVVVRFENGRSHRARVKECDDVIEIHALVARAAAVNDVADLPLRLWLRNRSTQLVSFRIDSRGRVCAEGWVPKPGLTAEELQYVLHHVAAESDRLEFILTGKDVD